MKTIIKTVLITLFCVALLSLLALNLYAEFKNYQFNVAMGKAQIQALQNQAVIRANQKAIYEELKKEGRM